MNWRGQHVGPIGIDIGARAIRMLQLRWLSDGCEVVAAGRAKLDSENATNAEMIKEKISSLLSANHFVGKDAVVCLTNDDVEIKSIRLPNMPAEELESAAEFEGLERFSNLGNNVTIRNIPAGSVGSATENLQEVIILGARTDGIEQRLSLLTDCGLRIVGMEYGANAFFRPFERFLERESDAEFTGTYVDIGHSGSRIIIVRGNNIVFLKNCSSGGRSLDELVANKLGITTDEAWEERHRILTEHEDWKANERAAEIVSAMTPGLDQLGKEIGLCLRYYAVTFRGEKPDRIVFGGSEVSHHAVREYLTEATQMEVVTGDPFRGIKIPQQLEDVFAESGLPEWTTAIGLALKNARRVNKEVKVA